ncbi:MAG TPA: hypothetical protein LFW10_04485 [Rickettsia endosymbiont of Diachasma alloeum]|nr:hypothetical protein [Rickettsia endosymbiont of Diachasma alloeum]
MSPNICNSLRFQSVPLHNIALSAKIFGFLVDNNNSINCSLDISSREVPVCITLSMDFFKYPPGSIESECDVAIVFRTVNNRRY